MTETGKALIADADARSALPFDALDDSILKQLSGGKRAPVELQSTLNLHPKDLALRLYKVSKQGFITYELKNATVDLMLTEKGFLRAKGGTDQMATPGAPPAPMAPPSTAPMQQAATTPMQPPLQPGTPQPATPPVPPALHGKPMNRKIIVIFVVLIVILALAYVLIHYAL